MRPPSAFACRALEAQKAATTASESCAQEAQASASAASAALEDQSVLARRLQQQLLDAEHRHYQELTSVQEDMRRQVSSLHWMCAGMYALTPL